jgi:uncharacterized protein YlzI (FlbEa/FlbD family)
MDPATQSARRLSCKGGFKMLRRSVRHLGMAVAAVMLSGGLLVPTALAAGPDHFGPFTWADTFYGSCGTDFDVRLDTHGWSAVTGWADEEGNVNKAIERVRAPSDVFTNLSTGRQIVVRGEFQSIYERVAGTDEFTVTISGFRYLINDPGVGVRYQDVGRIVYGDLLETIVLSQAGIHRAAYDEDIGPVFCALLAEPV